MSTLYVQVLKAGIYVQSVVFALIVVTNLLSIRILCSRTLRASPCTYYFVGYAIISIIYSCLVCPTQIIRPLLIGWENTSVGCNIYFYVLFLPPYLAQGMLVLASFDRYCSSSKSRRLHSTSTKRTACITIIISMIVIAIFMSPMSFIYYFNTNTGLCVQYTSLPAQVYVMSQMVIYYILIPIILIIFGILTIINIRQHAVRTVLQNLPTTHGRRTERQLARMLILQLFVHIILTLPFGTIYFINAFDSSSRTSYNIAIRYILLIVQECDYFATFFLYVFSGSIYREQFRQLFKFTKQNKLLIHPIQHQQILIN
ncbi:hypothetical protein I4U23_004511 [Adineta vaga]|nr:hypothetical protein I4U23_004511 [Adineta vaga]